MDIATDFIRAEQRERKILNQIYAWEVTPLSQELPADHVQYTLFKQGFVRNLLPSEIVNLTFRCQPLYQQLDKMIAETQAIWSDEFAKTLHELVDNNKQNRAKILQAYRQITPANPQTPELLYKIMTEHRLFLPPEMLNQLEKQVPSLTNDLNYYRHMLSHSNPLFRVPEMEKTSSKTPERSL